MAKTVWDAAQEGDTVAQHEVDKLDRGQSVYGAYQKIRDRVQTETEEDDEDGTSSSDDEVQDSSSDDEEPERVAAEDAILSAHGGRTTWSSRGA